MNTHVCFIHQNYPAQFGPISQFLLQHYAVNVTFLSEYITKPLLDKLNYIPYKPVATGHENTPYFFSRHFEEATANMHAVWQTLEKQTDTPDVFVGHAAFGTLGLLHAAYPEAVKIGFFEFFYHTEKDRLDNRPEFPIPRPNFVRIPLRNAVQLVELEYCTKGYSPTPFQLSTYPDAYKPKLSVLFDGIDTRFYQPRPKDQCTVLNRTWPADAPIVTYVSRGLEAMRGFDVFMDMAHRVSQQHDHVHFVIAGRDRTHYGSEGIHLKGVSFKDHVLSQRPVDLSRFHFVDWVAEDALVELFSLSACHFYWTVPFTLSWSLFQAMSSGAYILASDTAPVRDLIDHNVNGHRVAPHDVDAMVDRVLNALNNPQSTQPLRDAGRQTVVAQYDFDICLPKLATYFLGR